jgi:hypothetical protein
MVEDLNVAILNLAAESALGTSSLLATNLSGASLSNSSTATGELDALTVDGKLSLFSGHTTSVHSHIIYYLKIFIFFSSLFSGFSGSSPF